MTKIIYADNAATTQLSPQAFEAMTPFLTVAYGNPSAPYSLGRAAKQALEGAREKVAAAIGAKPEEIYFTSGGTESDNWAINAVARLKKSAGHHIISTAVEHPAVLQPLKLLEGQGYEVTCLPVDRQGHISLAELQAAIRPDTILITAMTANNETGTILPVAAIGSLARQAGLVFHTDAVQAAGHMPIDVTEMQVDLLSLSGHKFRGPKGTGVLYIKKGLPLPPHIRGGGQEWGRRSGTENVAGALGLAAALAAATDNLPANTKKITAMRDRLIEGVLKIPAARLTGDPVNRLPGIASFVFEDVEGEPLILMLDQKGICAASGSACSSGSTEPSHVLLAMGLPYELAYGALRLSLSEDNSEEDIDTILATLPQIIERLISITAKD
ncbi:MAG: aminotransferase class V-fold PLP-dependent enzyme [Clostridiales bacterium]